MGVSVGVELGEEDVEVVGIDFDSVGTSVGGYETVGSLLGGVLGVTDGLDDGIFVGMSVGE